TSVSFSNRSQSFDSVKAAPVTLHCAYSKHFGTSGNFTGNLVRSSACRPHHHHHHHHQQQQQLKHHRQQDQCDEAAEEGDLSALRLWISPQTEKFLCH
ncbi:hypothetical protein ATANTOWER_028135, partial [Ataeniobius toweri]|nr:hypothetical protein [Ataeniobius toweri]